MHGMYSVARRSRRSRHSRRRVMSHARRSRRVMSRRRMMSHGKRTKALKKHLSRHKGKYIGLGALGAATGLGLYAQHRYARLHPFKDDKFTARKSWYNVAKGYSPFTKKWGASGGAKYTPDVHGPTVLRENGSH